MTTSLLKWLDTVANVAILIVAVVVAAGLLGRYRSAPANRPPDKIQSVKVGDKCALLGVDWRIHKTTLVLALSTNCSYCGQSAAFYQRLSSAKSATAYTIAVFPQSESVGRAYLNNMKVRVDEVRQAAVHELNIPGTPTVLVVDDRGVITNIWIGKLSSDVENRVIETLQKKSVVTAPELVPGHVNSVSARDREFVTTAQLREMIVSRRKISIVDLRERPEYQTEHLVGSVNIPFLEIESRAVEELELDSDVVLYCGGARMCKTADGGQSLDVGYCKPARALLMTSGFRRVGVLTDNLSNLGAALQVRRR